MADKNAELIAGVFAELKATKPDATAAKTTAIQMPRTHRTPDRKQATNTGAATITGYMARVSDRSTAAHEKT